MFVVRKQKVLFNLQEFETQCIEEQPKDLNCH